MDQRRDDQLTTTDVAEKRELSADASERRAGWARPTQQDATTTVTEEAPGPPAAAADGVALSEERPITPQMPDDRLTDEVPAVEPQPERQLKPEEPAESRDHESDELDHPRPEAPSEGKVELMAADSRAQYRARWGDIQTGFIDDPTKAVRQADQLVADVMGHLAKTFAEEHGRLEERWSQGNEDTEHLRVALQRYRQFFGLLLKE